MLTEQEIEARRSRIGASDVASILGMPTFKGRNAYSTWLDKTDQLEPDTSNRKWINAGNRCEPVVLDYAEEQYGELARNVVVWDPQGGPIASTLDGQVVADNTPVEAKTSGIEGPIHGDWGEPGTDEVPDGYIVQCQTQMLCTGAELCHLVALLGGRGFCEFHIEPDDWLVKTIRNVSADFFDRYVQKRVDPRTDWADRLQNVHGIELLSDPCEPVLETVSRFRKTPGKVIAIEDPAPFIDWQEKRQVRLDAAKVEDAAKAVCLAELGDAEVAELPGRMLFTHTEQRTADIIDRNAMKAAGIYDQYAKPNTCRVARIKKAK